MPSSRCFVRRARETRNAENFILVLKLAMHTKYRHRQIYTYSHILTHPNHIIFNNIYSYSITWLMSFANGFMLYSMLSLRLLVFFSFHSFILFYFVLFAYFIQLVLNRGVIRQHNVYASSLAKIINEIVIRLVSLHFLCNAHYLSCI